VDLCELLWLRVMGLPNDGLIFWLEMESMGETLPHSRWPGSFHKRPGGGRLVRPPRLLVWFTNFLRKV